MLKKWMWTNVALPLWQQAEPVLLAKWNELKPELKAWLTEEFERWMPRIIESSVTAMTKVGVGIAVTKAEQGVDALTKAIPGDVDDKLVDQWLKPILDSMRGRGIG